MRNAKRIKTVAVIKVPLISRGPREAVCSCLSRMNLCAYKSYV